MARRAPSPTSCSCRRRSSTDDDAPVMAFAMAGYELVHHGEGRWNGVAIAARNGLSDRATSSRTSATGRSATAAPGAAGAASARRTSTRSTRRGWSRRPSTASGSSASTRRTAGSSARRSTRASSPGSSGSRRWLARDAATRASRSSLGGDFNVAPTDADVWDAAAAHGGTHVSPPERAAFRALLDWGLVDAYRLAARRAGPLHVVGLPRRHVPQELRDADRPPAGDAEPVAERVVDAEIDREARKGPPIPSDHAPLIDRPRRAGQAVRPGWDGALERIAARPRTTPRRLAARGAASLDDRVAGDPAGEAVWASGPGGSPRRSRRPRPRRRGRAGRARVELTSSAPSLSRTMR